MSINYNPSIVMTGLEWYVDINNTKSYPGTGTTWYDISGKNRHQTLTGSAAYTTVNNIKCIDVSTEGKYTVKASSTYTFTNSYTMIAWARPLADSQVSTWRTLWRTQPDDHPILIQDATNTIGYYDNNGGGFISYGLNVGTMGIENVWTMFTLLGTSGSTTLYINNKAYSGTVGYTTSGNAHDAFGAASGSQAFGYVSVGMLYNRALTDDEVAQNFNAFRGRYGV